MKGSKEATFKFLTSLLEFADGLFDVMKGKSVSQILWEENRRRYQKEKIDYRDISQSVSYLEKYKYIKIHRQDQQFSVKITQNGERRIQRFNIDNLVIKKPKKWDGEWRIVIFDIPEKRKTVRDFMRAKLKQIGFLELQKSVWVFPYPCQNEIRCITDYFQVDNNLYYVVAKKINHDKNLRDKFGLVA